LNRNSGHRGDAADAVGGLAQVVSFVRLLNVLDDERAVDDAHATAVIAARSVQIAIVRRRRATLWVRYCNMEITLFSVRVKQSLSHRLLSSRRFLAAGIHPLCNQSLHHFLEQIAYQWVQRSILAELKKNTLVHSALGAPSGAQKERIGREERRQEGTGFSLLITWLNKAFHTD